MKTTWRTVKLGDVADIQWGDTNTTKAKYTPNGYLAFSATGPDGFMNHYDFDREGVVLSAIGANCGDTWFVNGKWSCIKNTIRFWGEEDKADTRFLYYKTRNKNFWPQRGSAQPFISQTDARNIEITIPQDIDEQKRISGILAAFDEKIENNNRIIKNLEEMSQTIFKEWFVKFRFPGHEKVKMVDSELGKIPDGWEVRKIKDIVKIQKGLSYSSTEICDKSGGIPMLNLANFLRGGGFNPLGVKYYSGRYKETDLIQGGDIIIAMTDLTSNREVIGHPARVPKYIHWNKILISLDVCIVKTEEILKDFIYYMMLRKDFAFRMASSASGTNISHLNKAVIEDYIFSLPDKDLLNKFRNFVKPIIISKDGIEIENRKLAASRDLLLPKLMSGEIKI